MPMIRVQLSTSVDEGTKTSLMQSLSKAVAGGLGKPESYMMVVLEPETAMLMAAQGDPAALVEIRSVGSISPDQARKLSATVSEIIASTGISADRIYSNFMGVQGAMWGHGDRTFG